MVRKLIVALGVLAIFAAILLAQEGTKTKPKLGAVKEKFGAVKQAVKEKVKQAVGEAKEGAKEGTRNAGAEAIDKAVESYVAAFNKNDAVALASHWSETGVYVDRETGARTEGREAIQTDFETLFKDRPGARLAIDLTGHRQIKPDVMTIEGRATAMLPGDEPSTTAFSAILLKQGEQWLLDSVHESPPATPPSAHDALKELEWMVGNWVDDAETTSVTTNVRWGAGESFLVRSFVVATADGAEQQGTQVIGWDPIARQIRCWNFFSDGSFGEGVWSKSGSGWLVKGTHTLADGRLASGTQAIERVDDDTITVQLIGREVDGEPVPSSEKVSVVRIASGDGAQAAPGTTKEITKPAGETP